MTTHEKTSTLTKDAPANWEDGYTQHIVWEKRNGTIEALCGESWTPTPGEQIATLTDIGKPCRECHDIILSGVGPQAYWQLMEKTGTESPFHKGEQVRRGGPERRRHAPPLPMATQFPTSPGRIQPENRNRLNLRFT